MANLPVVDGKFKLAQTVSASGTTTTTLTTQNSFVDKNIVVETTTPAGAQTIAGGTLSKGSGATDLDSLGLTDGVTTQPTKKIILHDETGLGKYVLESSGSGTVTRADVTKQVTTAGFFSADGSAVTAIASASETSNTATKKFYVNQSTLSASSVTPATTAQTVTISEGYYHEARTVTVSAMTGTTVTTSFANTGMSTYFNAGTSSSNSVSITPQYSNSAGFVDAHTNANNGGIAYYSIKLSTTTETVTSVSGTTANRGTRTESVGWKNTAETLDVATFNNEATTGHTYVDISSTTSAPVLVSGDYLYIDKGWTDDVKISLARLVPDGSNISGHADAILSGYSAYDNSGNLVAGSIPTYAGAYTVA